MSSPAKTWSVVLFESDNSVQAVPTRWIDGDNCLWPVVPRDKLASALRNCEFNSHWPSHKVRIFRNATYEDYTLARTKAAKAEYSSDLNSDAEISVKRSRKKRVLSSSDSESDSQIINTKKHQKPLQNPPMWNDNSKEKDDPGNVETPAGNRVRLCIKSANSNKDSSTSTKPVDIVEEKLTETPVGSRVKLSIKTANSHKPNSTSTKPAEHVNIVEEKVTESSTNGSCRCNPQVLYNIQSILLEVNSKIDKMAKSRPGTESKQNVLEKSGITFPVTNQEKLNDFEEFLSSNENYQSFISLFAKMGGVNLFDFIKRCLREILGDTLALQYSYIGRKGKKRFCDLTLSKALLECAEQSGLPRDRKEIEVAIGCWLRKAKDRMTRLNRKQ